MEFRSKSTDTAYHKGPCQKYMKDTQLKRHMQKIQMEKKNTTRNIKNYFSQAWQPKTVTRS